MIRLHKLGRTPHPFHLNPDLILTVEANPDTVVVLTTGSRLVVVETPDQVAEAVRTWRASVPDASLWGITPDAFGAGAEPATTAVAPPDGSAAPSSAVAGTPATAASSDQVGDPAADLPVTARAPGCVAVAGASGDSRAVWRPGVA